MDKAQLAKILEDSMAKYKSIGYATYQNWIRDRTIESFEIKEPTGKLYQIEIQAFWDDKKGEAIRVLGTIDDGRSSWKKLFRSLPTYSFIVGPNGR